MSDRPQHLVIVTHKGQDRLDLFSAHCDEADANIMYTRLKSLLRSTDSSVHMVTVPEASGVIDAPALPSPLPAPINPDVTQPKVVRKKLSQQEFEEETRAMLQNGESLVISEVGDADFAEAFS